MENKKYIEMILALPEEFFKDWVWKKGDRYLKIYPNGDRYEGYIGNLDCWKGNYPYEKEIRPIPSQKQLLKIYQKKWFMEYESLALLFFANYIEDKIKEDHEFCFKHRESDEIALLFVRETCYGEVWNGKIWTLKK